jgi:hypothetical protein
LFEHSIALADSVHFDLLKVNTYIGIFQMYFNDKDYKKGMGYLNLHPEVMNDIDHAALHFIIDDYYARAYLTMGRLDSAEFYFRKAEPQMESKGGPFAKAGFYDQAGDFYKAKGAAGRDQGAWFFVVHFSFRVYHFGGGQDDPGLDA